MSSPLRNPLLQPVNALDFAFQFPVWLFLYGFGLIPLIQAFQWLAYAFGWWHHPSRYALPHVMVLSLLADLLLWLRSDSKFPSRFPMTARAGVWTVVCAMVIGVPLVFFEYVAYLMWLWEKIVRLV